MGILGAECEGENVESVDIHDPDIALVLRAAPVPNRASCLELAWLITLHLYSGEEEVCFVRIAGSGLTDTQLRLRGILRPQDTVEAIRDRIQYDTPQVHSVIALRSAHRSAIRDVSGDFSLPLPSHFDICLDLKLCRGEPKGPLRLLFRCGCVSRHVRARMARTLRRVLEICYLQPSISLRDLATMTYASCDQDTILRWNAEVQGAGQQRLVHEIFSEIAKHYPHAQAIASWDGQMTYAELDSLSSNLARHIAPSVSKQDRWIALCFEKSRWAVIAMLAALKAGASCVLLDPSYPDERVCQILQATGARTIMVSSGSHHRRFTRLISRGDSDLAHILEVPCDLQEGKLRREHVCDFEVDSGCPAFAIFTSGSTGRPKGVVLSHRNICTSVTALNAALDICVPTEDTERARVLQFASYAFDASLSDIFVALLSGSTICIPSEDERRDHLQAFMLDKNVSVAFLTPTVGRILQPSALKSTLKQLILIGELVTSTDTNRWLGAGTDLYNGYGPTESTFGATLARCDYGKSPSNIGMGLNYRTWLVSIPPEGYTQGQDDSSRYLVPIGATGELFLEGPALSLGYLNDDERTAASFLYDPAWLTDTSAQQQRGRRVYRTGDTVRYAADGSLEYIGRIAHDDQAKLGGQRVQLDEIEYLLAQAATNAALRFQQVSVCIPQSGPYGGRLVSTWVLGHDVSTVADSITFSPCCAEIRARSIAYLSTRIPQWMTPSAWINANHLPMTHSGKRDSRGLRTAIESLTREQYEGLYHPSSQERPSGLPREIPVPFSLAQLLQICGHVLHIPTERMFAEQSFLGIGGDSITAMNVSAKLRQDTNKSLGTHELLNSSSIYNAALRIRALDYDKSALIDRTSLKKRLLCQASKCGLARDTDNIEDVFPCTPAQDAMLLSQSKNVGHVYQVSTTWRVTESRSGQPNPIDIQCLALAWDHVIQCNPAMRTMQMELIDEPGVSVNVVRKHGDRALDIVHVPADDEAALLEAMRLIPSDHCTKQHFKPPYHVLVCTSGEGHRVLMRLDINHVMLDGLSATAVLHQLSSTYCSMRAGMPLPAGPSSHSMREFAWYVQDPRRKAHSIQYWRNHLEHVEPCNFPRLVDIETAQESTAISTATQLSTSVSIEGIDIALLDLLLAGNEVTRATFLAVAWSLVLYSYTNSTDLLFGYVSSGRDIPACGLTSEDIGVFISLLIARVRLADLLSSTTGGLSRLLKSFQSTASENADHQFASVAEIQEALTHSRDKRLFNTMIAVTPLTSNAENHCAAEARNLTLDCLETQNSSEFDLSLVVGTRRDRLDISVDFNSSHISLAHAKNIANTLHHIMVQMIRDLDGHSADFFRPSPHDMTEIWNWNSPGISPVNLEVTHFLEKSMRNHANDEAILGWDGRFTYRQLDDVSAVLAHHLRSRYLVGRGSRVLLCFKSSVWAIVSQVAVLRAGACFVMADSNFTYERMQHTLEETDPSVLLCCPRTKPELEGLLWRGHPLGARLEVITSQFMDSLLRDSTTIDIPDEDKSIEPNAVAYIIYTSGSTSVPKGAMISHRAINTGAERHASMMGISRRSRVLLLSALHFDMAIENMIMTLRQGGCICMPSEDARHDVHGVTAFALESQANWMSCTPSFLTLFKGQCGPEAFATIDIVLLGGEPMTRSLRALWTKEIAGRSRPLVLMNGFGPSECALGCCILNPNITSQSSCTEIGRGFRATTWVVDQHNHHRLLPVGAIGELILEGPCLAEGYVGEPNRTSQAFITSPKWHREGRPAHPPARLYKTGDLVRYGADGALHYMGRKDDQLKINGIRTEIADIENSIHSVLTPELAANSGIVVRWLENASVLAGFVYDTTSPGRRLGGVDAKTERGMVRSTTDTFRTVVDEIQHRSGSIPNHMIPQVFIPLSWLPVTSSGKIDRRSLDKSVSDLTLDDMRAFTLDRGQDFAPASQAERQLADAWRHVLKVDAISVNANFFRLGGGSLAAIALRAEVRRALHVDLRMAEIYARPILKDMAVHLQEIGSLASEVSSPKPFSLLPQLTDGVKPHGQLLLDVARACGSSIQASDIEDLFPCTPMQETLIAATVRDGNAGSATSSYSTHVAYELASDMDIDKFQKAWAGVLVDCEVLRSRIVLLPMFGSLVAVVRRPEPIERCHVNDGGLEQHLSSLRGANSLGYGSPLFRAGIVHEPSRTYLVLSCHHALYDGWSLRLIWEAVVRSYHAHRALPDRSSPKFVDFVRFLQQRPKENSIYFWNNALRNTSSSSGFTFPDVPVHHQPRTEASLTFNLTGPSHEAERTARESGMTVDTLCHAAWALLVALYTSSTVVTFGSTRTGRNADLVGIETIIGPTMTTVPLQFTLDPLQTTVSDFLRQTMANLTALSPHQHFGSQRISELGPEAKLACEYTSALTVQTPGDMDELVSGSGSPSLQVPSVEPRISLVEPVKKSGFHHLPLALQIFANSDATHVVAEVDFDPVCISDSELSAAMQQYDHLLSRLWSLYHDQPTATLASVMTTAPAHITRLSNWNNSTASDVSEHTHLEECFLLHQPFEAMVRRQPLAAALVAHEEHFSYAALNEAASALSTQILRHRSSHHDIANASTMIGLCFDHCTSAVVSMLAVSMAGCAMMPLRPTDPGSRIQHLIGVSQCSLVLACPHHTHRIQSEVSSGQLHKVIVWSVDTSALNEAIKASSCALPVPAVNVVPTDLAYVLYTSGSTKQGQPKGVMVDHRASTSAVTTLARHWGLDQHTRRLQFTEYSFDNSIEDVFGTLSVGGCICVPSESDRVNDLIGFCVSHNVNSLHVPASVLRLHFGTPGVNGLNLESIVIGGEPVTERDVQLLRGWVETSETLQAFVAYGSTETCIDCVARQVTSLETAVPVNSIGRPIRASLWKPWVLSPITGALAPLGAKGELCIEGSALARGYLGSESLTAQKFMLVSPLGQDDSISPKSRSARIYHTGDFVQHSSDGSLLFLGRADAEIKLHGRRVDIESVETQILEALKSEVSALRSVQVAVAACDDGRLHALLESPVDNSLSAYMFGTTADAATKHDKLRRLSDSHSGRVRQWLATRLPEFMIPKSFTAVDCLPATASGKRDRTRIRAMLNAASSHGLREGTASDRADEGAADKDLNLLRQWWATVLPNVSSPSGISTNAHFFEMGGHSVAAIQLASLARSSGRRLRYEDIFMFPTLAEMVRNIRNMESDSPSRSVPHLAPFQLLDSLQRDGILSEITSQYGIPRDQIQDAYPCTPLQESLMAATARLSGSYIMAEKVRLPRDVSLASVQAAFKEAFAPLETLRACIVHVPTLVCQLLVVLHDQPAWSEAESASAFLETARKEHDYGKPLVRMAYVNPTSSGTKADHGCVVFVAHHCAYDRPMIDSLWRVVNERLGLRTKGMMSSQEPGPMVPFRYFVQHMESKFDREKAAGWWRTQLEGYQEPLISFPPGISSSTGRRPVASSNLFRIVALPAAHRRMKTTLATVARAAWSLVLSHYTASQDTVYGVVVNSAALFSGNAPAIDLAHIAGPTISSVPSRARLDFAAMTVSELLALVHDQALAETKSAYLGLHKIAGLDQACWAACQISTILVVQNQRRLETLDGTFTENSKAPEMLAAAHGLGSERACLEGEDGFMPHPIVVSCHPLEGPNGHSMGVHILYDPTLVTKERARSVLDVFCTVVRNLVDSRPDTILCQMSVLSRDSRSKAVELVHLNGTPPSPSPALLHDLVRSMSRSIPTEIALLSWDGRLTYHELDGLASKWASRLARLSDIMGKQCPVPFMLDRSMWAVVAMLAILKAGCSFVPLDPRHPTKRLQSIVRALQASLIITQRKHIRTAGSLACDLFLIEDADQMLALQSDAGSSKTCQQSQPTHEDRDHHQTELDPDSTTAYTLFTSGSTGTPKGVVVRHGPLCTTLKALGERPPLPAGSRFLHLGNYVFDVSMYEIFVTLLRGGTVCIPSEHERLNDLQGSIKRFGVTDAAMTPSVSRSMDPSTISETTVLRRLRLGGELVTRSDRARWTTPGLGVQLICIYGTTEAGIANFHHAVNDQDLDHRLIGRSINCHGWVLNSFNGAELAPPGAIGELCLEGPVLAAGYLDDPAKTKTVFLHGPAWIQADMHDPPERHASRRVYRTGDLVYHNFDGTLSYVRRKDHDSQIKLRGLRIDLDEIASAIEQALAPDDMRAVAELFTPPGMSNPTIGAAVQVRAGGGSSVRHLDVEKIQASLAQALPEYMIPGHFVVLTDLPLNPSGKLDRQALRELLKASPPHSHLDLGKNTESPVTQLTSGERTARDMIFHVLELDFHTLESVPRSANFFHLGGDSIGAIRLVSFARSRGFNLQVVDVFEKPTIEGIAGRLGTATQAERKSCNTTQSHALDDTVTLAMGAALCNVPIDSVEDIYPCTAAQEVLLPRTAMFSLHSSASASLDPEQLWSAVAACVTQHPILRTRIVRPRGVTHSSGPEATNLVQVVLKAEHELHRLREAWDSRLAPEVEQRKDDEHNCFGRPLHDFRNCIEARNELVWTISHALYDGWSMQLMIQELNRLLRRPSGLNNTTLTSALPYSEFAHHQARLRDDTAQSSFWRTYLAGTPHPQKQLFAYAGLNAPVRDMQASYNFRLPSSAGTDRDGNDILKGSAHSTPAMVVLGAWTWAVANALESHDLVISYVTSGRGDAALANDTCVGPTLAILPLRIRGVERSTQPISELAGPRESRGSWEVDAANVQNEVTRTMPYEASGTDAARTLGSLPLEMVIQPAPIDRSYCGTGDQHNGKDAALLRIGGVKAVGSTGGGFLVECTLTQDRWVSVEAYWDRRAATKDQVDELFGKVVSRLE